MSARTKDRIFAIIMFLLIFPLWVYINYNNYVLSVQNADNIETIAKQLKIDWVEVEVIDWINLDDELIDNS